MRRVITVHILAEAERRAHEALEDSNDANAEFALRLEPRTPLDAAIGVSTLLRLHAVKPLSIDQLERLEPVENASAHLPALVNGLLDSSRSDACEMSMHAWVPFIGGRRSRCGALRDRRRPNFDDGSTDPVSIRGVAPAVPFALPSALPTPVTALAVLALGVLAAAPPTWCTSG